MTPLALALQGTVSEPLRADWKPPASSPAAMQSAHAAVAGQPDALKTVDAPLLQLDTARACVPAEGFGSLALALIK